MDISIIIINYNTEEITKNCIDSIFKYSKDISFEIILVDNASTDGSKETFTADIRIKYIYLSENVGFGKANNTGYKLSTGKYIFLLNSDTLLKNNALRLFYDKMETLPLQIGYTGCILKDNKNEYASSFGYFITIKRCLKYALYPYKKRLLLLFNYTLQQELHEQLIIKDDYKEVEVIIGADLFIRNEIIKKHGLFDPVFFMYHEENDMQRKYYNEGFRGAIIKGPQIIHLEGKSSLKIHRIIYSTKSTFIYLKKWNTYSKYLAFRFIYAFLSIPFLFKREYPLKDRLYYMKQILAPIN